MITLTKEQLEAKVDFINKYGSKLNASSASEVDPNANITTKNVTTLTSEIHKDINVQLKRFIVSNYIREMYGDNLAQEYNRQIENHEIYVHDESHPLFPYCVAVSMAPFLENGLRGLGGQSDAPKHLEGFCGGFENLVFILASQFAGAVATVEFLLCFDYFARKDYGDDYLTTHTKVIKDKLQAVVYKLNQPAGARSFQCPFWNISVFDENYFHHLFDDFVFPNEEDEDLAHPKWSTLSKLQSFFLNWFNEERKRALLTFPVVTAALLTKDNDVVDEEFVDMLSEQMSKGNSFFNYMSDSVDSLASCCRLRNSLSKEFSYTLGAGGVSTGSINVITLNMNRLVQDADRKGIDIAIYLKEQLDKVYKYQHATLAHINNLYLNGLLPAYSAHFIHLQQQFLTTGVNGVLEAAESRGIQPTNNKEYKDFLQTILKVVYDESQKASEEEIYHYEIDRGNGIERFWSTNTIDGISAREWIETETQAGGCTIINKEKLPKCRKNCEFVPAENLGIKNYKWDSKDGYKVNPNRNCYNSYLYAVEASDEEVSVIDKFVLHGGDILQYLDGGSALHLNLCEYPTKEGYRKLFKVAAQTGCNYWTTNIPVTVCHDCGYIDKQTRGYCIKCGSKNIGYGTRIIGYLREIENFSEGRQIEAAKRFYSKVKENSFTVVPKDVAAE